MIRIPISKLQEKAEVRPIGYLEDCMDAGNVCGDTLVLDDSAWRKLCKKYRKPLPGMKAILANFGMAMLEWLDAGFPVTSREQFDQRHSICQSCDEWTGTRCAMCGCCIEFKPWIRTAKCPLNLWPKLY